MKKKFLSMLTQHAQTPTQKFAPALLLAFVMICLTTHIARSQGIPTPYTKRYNDPATTFFRFTDNVVLETFRGSANNGHGFVMARPLDATNGQILEVTLLDDAGVNVAPPRRYSTNGEDLVPKAITYNEVSQQYLITGNCHGSASNIFYVWYLVLDQDLNTVINFSTFNLQSSAPWGSSSNSAIVMDVCPTIDPSAPDQFAFVGTILRGGQDPTPRVVGATQPVVRRMFITSLNTGTNTLSHQEYQISATTPTGATSIDQFYLPSCIIEIPGTGFVVTGTGAKVGLTNAKGFFYFNADYVLNDISFTSLDITNSADISGENLYYDPIDNEVFVSGSLTSSSVNAFFFDKLRNLTAVLDPFSTNVANWNGNLGIKSIPTTDAIFGLPKTGWIGNTYSNGNKITGRIYSSSVNATLPVLTSVLYNDFDLAAWTTNQFNTIEYYPRVTNVVPAVQYYPAHGINDILYPNHSCREIWATNGMADMFIDFYGMAGLSEVGTNTRVVMNTCDNWFDNPCAHAQSTATLSLIGVASIGTISVVNTPLTVSPANPTLNIDTSTITITDCDITPFKNVNNSNSEAILGGAYLLLDNGYEISISCAENDRNYKVLNMVGATVFQGVINNSLLNFQTYNLANGMYAIEILDGNGKHSTTVKYVKH